jgi:superfamily II DNA or RNA helicase
MQQLNALARKEGELGRVARHLKTLFLKRKSVVFLARARIDCAVYLLKMLLPEKKVVVFTERIKTANAIYEQINRLFPRQACLYHSGLADVQKHDALARYQSGATSAILCCRSLDEGLDVPHTDAGIIVSSSTSTRQRIQRIGRIIRKNDSSGPKQLYYLYLPDTVESPDLLPTGAFDLSPRSHDLAFSSTEQRLSNPSYDKIAETVLEQLRTSGATNQQLHSARHHIERGAILTDYLLPEPACLDLLAHASHGEREYLSAMLFMIRASGKAGTEAPTPSAFV